MGGARTIRAVHTCNADLVKWFMNPLFVLIIMRSDFDPENTQSGQSIV